VRAGERESFLASAKPVPGNIALVKLWLISNVVVEVIQTVTEL
jgi:hypothetical protein